MDLENLASVSIPMCPRSSGSVCRDYPVACTAGEEDTLLTKRSLYTPGFLRSPSVSERGTITPRDVNALATRTKFRRDGGVLVASPTDS